MERSAARSEGQQDATCTACSKTLMEHEWETDTGPDGEEKIRFCPECGEQPSFSASGKRDR